jgi:pectate lyase
MVGECSSSGGNPVDDCWRCNTSWANNRQRLADCTVGFGRGTIGGKNGKTYVVTDPSDDADPASPAPGTLRYGLVQQEPLWITFARDMTIRPKQELLVASRKTVDGRGADVVIGDVRRHLLGGAKRQRRYHPRDHHTRLQACTGDIVGVGR